MDEKRKDALDEVLQPYVFRHSAGADLTDVTNEMDRIPNLYAPDGGFLPEFVEFYHKVVNAIVWRDVKSLLNLAKASKFMNAEEFQNLVDSLEESNFFQTLKDVAHNSQGMKAIDVELNLNRFTDPHRNIVGSFYVSVFYTEKSSISNMGKAGCYTHVVKKHTEIMFSYIKGEFVLLMDFPPFVNDSSALENI